MVPLTEGFGGVRLAEPESATAMFFSVDIGREREREDVMEDVGKWTRKGSFFNRFLRSLDLPLPLKVTPKRQRFCFMCSHLFTRLFIGGFCGFIGIR